MLEAGPTGAAPAGSLPPAQLLEGAAAAPLFEHINFWKDAEISDAKAQHPEVEVGT